MKLRVKYRNRTSTIDFGSEDSSCILLSTLRQRILDEDISSDPACQLSLNKKDPLEGDNRSLSDFGIVSGDSIFILSSQDDAENLDQLPAAGGAAFGASAFSAPVKARDDASLCENAVVCGAVNTNLNNGNEDEVPQASTTQSNPDTSAIPTTSSAMQGERSGQESGAGAVAMEMEPERVMDAAVLRCLSEPELCRESTAQAIPARLQHLLESARCCSPKDALWIALCVMMREAGFEMPETAASKEELQDLRLQENWNRLPYYKQQFVHPMAKDKTCLIIGMPLPASLVVYGSMNEPAFQSGQLQLKPGEYIRDHTSVSAGCYKNLEKLSLLFKDTVCSPLLQEIQSALGLPPHHGILSLPHELKLRLLSYLPPQGITSLGQTCQSFQAAYKDQTVWRRRYLLDFGRRDDMSLSQNWYQLYKVDFNARKERRKMMQMYFEEALPPTFPLRGIDPYAPLFPPNAGMLGGDYDLDPDFSGIGGQFGPHFGPRFLPRPRFNLPGHLRPPFMGPPHGGNPPNRFRSPFGGGGSGGFGFFSPHFM